MMIPHIIDRGRITVFHRREMRKKEEARRSTGFAWFQRKSPADAGLFTR
jgi:hypothetical protein